MRAIQALVVGISVGAMSLGGVVAANAVGWEHPGMKASKQSSGHSGYGKSRAAKSSKKSHSKSRSVKVQHIEKSFWQDNSKSTRVDHNCRTVIIGTCDGDLIGPIDVGVIGGDTGNNGNNGNANGNANGN